MKKNNKGFSLVELIIVIAIMAILAGAIAPALIRYIDKSRKSNDVSSAKTIKTAVETAMSNEKTYEILTTATGGTLTDKDSNTIAYAATVTINPGDPAFAGTATSGTTAVAIAGFTPTADITATDVGAAQDEIAKNVGEKMPRIKFKKNAADEKNSSAPIPSGWTVYISNGGSVIVGISCGTGTTGEFYQLAPEVSSYYQ